jgi:NAD(P)-dependent dehydrogenase (short-subunit alcohol dehydrogenase family)
MNFKNRQALVTGGTSGIGLAVTQALVDRGCQVIATGVNAREIESFPVVTPSARPLQLDVTDTSAIEKLTSQFERLDLLVNCAGILLRDGREFHPDAFREVMEVNLIGMMRVCHACLPSLAACRGNIINIASLYSWFGARHAPAYSASKGGVVQLSKSLALAWAEKGVRVNAVLPGWIETALTEPVRSDPERNRRILERTPLARWGSTQEVAQAVIFLASDEASFITGAVLPVDGGYSAA